MKRREWRQALILTVNKVQGEPLLDPDWASVERAALEVTPKQSVVLLKRDGRHIRADGAKLVHTIAFYQDAESSLLMIGRSEGGKRRGIASVSDDRLVVSPLEYWGADGVEVFRAFFDDADLSTLYVLRDPKRPCTPAEIDRACS